MAVTSINTSISAHFSTYEAVLEHLFVRTGAGIMLGLEPVAALLRLLGDPHRTGMRFVVVAGTNGKGTTSAMTAAALQRAGHRVGLYTSPHLLRFTERIRINGEEASRDQVVRLYQQITELEPRCPRPPTYFEVVTAMALCLFAEAEVDIAVLEVGLGGRLDATGVVDKDLAVIMPVGLDHQHLLGNTIAAIAAEKAAIIAPGKPVVVAPQDPEAHTVIARLAEQRGATLVPAASLQPDGDSWRLENEGAQLELGPGVSRAPFVRQNLGAAWTVCRQLDAGGISCPDTAFAESLDGFVWPGRYQWLKGHRGCDLLLDAAHNPPGIEALLAALHQDPRLRHPSTGAPRPIHCVFSGLQDKPAASHAEHLRRRVSALYLCPIPIRRGLSGSALAAVAAEAPCFASVADALAAAEARELFEEGVVLVTGSIFLLAEVLEHVFGADRDPPVAF